MPSVKKFVKHLLNCERGTKEYQCKRCHGLSLEREKKIVVKLCEECEIVIRELKVERDQAIREAFGYNNLDN
jgi:hypothetical protein